MDTEPPESPGQPSFIIDMSVNFAKIYTRLPANQSDFIDNFIDHVEEKGLIGLPGRLKQSDDIPTSDKDWLVKVKYAQKYNLWHYHAGYPAWDMTKPLGDWTSQWVLHMMMHPCGARSTLVHWDLHPPFNLPKKPQLFP